MYKDLKLSDRARVIEMAVRSGITDLDTIEEVYNTFAEGGPKEKLIERINSTSDANFVQRLKDPNREYIVNPNGSISTHSMAYVTQDGRAIVYPEVQQINGSLVRVNPAEALDSAISRRDTLMMSIPEAEWLPPIIKTIIQRETPLVKEEQSTLKRKTVENSQLSKRELDILPVGLRHTALRHKRKWQYSLSMLRSGNTEMGDI